MGKTGDFESPVIFKPKDESRVRQLELKLEEYRKRLRERSAYKPPEMDSNWWKVRVLEKVLGDEGSGVKTSDLAYEILRDLNQEVFDSTQMMFFDNACAVVEDYVLTGGQTSHGGTGLPDVG